jgi:hypothetical protein
VQLEMAHIGRVYLYALPLDKQHQRQDWMKVVNVLIEGRTPILEGRQVGNLTLSVDGSSTTWRQALRQIWIATPVLLKGN